MMTERSSKSEEFNALPEEIKKEIFKIVDNIDTRNIDDLNNEIARQKELGYIYSEIQPIKYIIIKELKHDFVKLNIYYIIQLPHLKIYIGTDYASRDQYEISYLSIRYTKQRNSIGNIIKLAVEKVLIESETAKKLAEEAEKEKKKIEFDQKYGDLKKYKSEWIAQYGSDQLKKSVDLGLENTYLFIREWESQNLDSDINEITEDEDIEIEDLDFIPSLEQMQKFEEIKNKKYDLPIKIELKWIRVIDISEDAYQYEDTTISKGIAIIYNIDYINSRYTVYQYI